MKVLKLTKGLSYTFKGVTYKKGVLKGAEDSVAEELLATGRFVAVAEVSKTDDSDKEETSDDAQEEVQSTETGKASNEGVTVAALEKMSKAELLSLAEEMGIDISGCTNNAQRVNAIAEALGLSVSE